MYGVQHTDAEHYCITTIPRWTWRRLLIVQRSGLPSTAQSWANCLPAKPIITRSSRSPTAASNDSCRRRPIHPGTKDKLTNVQQLIDQRNERYRLWSTITAPHNNGEVLDRYINKPESDTTTWLQWLAWETTCIICIWVKRRTRDIVHVSPARAIDLTGGQGR